MQHQSLFAFVCVLHHGLGVSGAMPLSLRVGFLHALRVGVFNIVLAELLAVFVIPCSTGPFVWKISMTHQTKAAMPCAHML